jgi:anti-sigma factor RsiW
VSADQTPHAEAALLPWYLSGTLEAGDARAVERHLEACAACRAEREQWTRLRAALATEVESRPAPPPGLFAAVQSRIAGQARAAAGVARRAEPWWERWAAAIFDLLPPRLAPATALAVIVLELGLLAGAGVLVYRATHGPAVTLSGPETGPPPVAGAVRLRVAFRENATAGEIGALLQRLDARIVGGPSAAGFYLVEAPPSVEGGASIETLERSGLTRFVERVE